MASEKQLKCSMCDCQLVSAGVKFSYLDNPFSLTALRCPKCGQVFVSEEFADGQIRFSEIFLEDRRLMQG